MRRRKSFTGAGVAEGARRRSSMMAYLVVHRLELLGRGLSVGGASALHVGLLVQYFLDLGHAARLVPVASRVDARGAARHVLLLGGLRGCLGNLVVEDLLQNCHHLSRSRFCRFIPPIVIRTVAPAMVVVDVPWDAGGEPYRLRPPTPPPLQANSG